MKTAFLYAGQGSQHAGMGQDLYEQYPEFAKVIDLSEKDQDFADSMRDIYPDFHLKKLLFDTSDEDLAQTRNTQPAMAAFAAGVTAVLYAHGIRPQMAAGLSLGEYSALHAAGVFDAGELIRLTAYRGRAMEKAAEGISSSMYAVMGLPFDEVKKACESVQDAGVVQACNYNTEKQTVIGGETEAVKKAAEAAKAMGARRCIPLHVSGPFHTSLMEPASVALHEYFQKMTFKPMQFPVIFNCTARPLQEGCTIPQMLEKQVKSTVRMKDTIDYLAAQGIDTVLEVGPGRALSGFVRKTAPQIKTYRVETADDMKKVLELFAAES